jgi:hypothetical protein
MLIDSQLIQSAVSGAMILSPQAKARQWSQRELEEVEALLPYHSPDIVGQMLGRSGNAIRIKRKRRGILASSKSEGWLTANQVRVRLGMADGRPVIGWIKKGLVLGHQIKGDSTWLVYETSLRRWITSPVSWAYFDPSRITDQQLAHLVKLSQQHWNDTWLSTREVADMKGTDTKTVLMAIKRGQLSGVHLREKDGRHAGAAWAFWAVKRSEAERWKYKEPTFDLMDEQHAFMLLARAIGLSNERIGILCGLSTETIHQRMRMIDKLQLALQLIQKHKRLRYVSTSRPTVAVHADWRKYADQFPHVRRAFERHMCGKASTDDCYLITRILKCQVAASGVKCNVSALGKCSPESIKRLLANMRQLGITPHLPKRKKSKCS